MWAAEQKRKQHPVTPSAIALRSHTPSTLTDGVAGTNTLARFDGRAFCRLWSAEMAQPAGFFVPLAHQSLPTDSCPKGVRSLPARESRGDVVAKETPKLCLSTYCTTKRFLHRAEVFPWNIMVCCNVPCYLPGRISLARLQLCVWLRGICAGRYPTAVHDQRRR